MKIDPPIPVKLPFGDGHATEMEGDIITVVLDSGEVVKVDGNTEARLERIGPEIH